MEKIQVIKVSDNFGYLIALQVTHKDWTLKTFGISKVKAARYCEHVC